MQLTPEEQTRLDELSEKKGGEGSPDLKSNEWAQMVYLLSKQGYEEEDKDQPGLVFNAKAQQTLFTNSEMDRYRRPGTVQRRLFDGP
ncbi:hypothetical protein SAMN06295888_1641 [Desulfonatronum zhilinae]|nr:hypothetical protein SAMN06295888_1641 [Desulfonatronum zhilinae]